MVDVCLRATSPSARLEVALAISTRVVRRAKEAHDLAPTSLVALGRLLTAAGLAALTSKQEGTIGAQVLSQGRIGQLMVDANEQGHLRGFAKVPSLAFPVTAEERASRRRSVASGVLPGQLSVVRRDAKGQYAQSAVELEHGEVDRDFERFLERSDQVPTVLASEVLLDGDQVQLAAGVLVQAMPDGDRQRLEEIRAALADGGLAALLGETTDPQALLERVQPDAEVVEVPVILQWKCRCSHERVVRSLQLLSPTDLAEMIEAEEPAHVACDFCAAQYTVSVPEIREVFEGLVKAEG